MDAMTGSNPQNVVGMGRETVPPKKKNAPSASSNVHTKKKKLTISYVETGSERSLE